MATFEQYNNNKNNNNKVGELENFGYTVSALTTQWLTQWLRSKTWLTESQSVTHFTSQRVGEGYGFTTLLYRIHLQFSDTDVNIVRSLYTYPFFLLLLHF